MLSNTGIILSMDNKKVQTDTFNNNIVNANVLTYLNLLKEK